jgi:hypothetical protein
MRVSRLLLAATAAATAAAPARAFELWVGGRDLTNSSNVVRWLLGAPGGNGSLSWADGISVGFPAIYAPADLRALSAAGVRLLPCVHASLETMQRQLFDNGDSSGGGRSAPDTALFSGAYTAELPDFRAGTALGPQPFMWWSLTEDDSSGVGFPFEQLAIPPSSHADAWAQFDNYLQRAQVLARAVAPGTPLVAQVGFAEQAHAHAARGATLMLLERANDDVGDLSTAMAFGRGAARQYNASFGVDLSWWWGVLYSGVNRLGGSFHRRHAYLAWAAGASVINIEGGDGLCDGDGVALELGRELQSFGELVRPLSQRGVAPALLPAAPVLLVLPKDHGFSTRPYWLTQGQGYGYARLPPRVGDGAIGAFFATAFPGSGFAQDPWPFGSFASDDPPASMWALSSLTAPYAPRASDASAAAPYLPFGTFANRSAAAADFAASGRDPAPWRPMADSTWGHIFDVAVAGLGLASAGQRDATPNNVFGGAARRQHRPQAGPRRRPDSSPASQPPSSVAGDDPGAPPLPLEQGGYAVAIVMGPVNLTATLKAQLISFATGGGHVIVAAGVVGPADGDLTGLASLLPELRVGRAWRWTGPGQQQPQQREAFRFVPAPMPSGTPPSNVTVLAATVASLDACGGAPCALATRFALGAGAVTTVLVPWFEAGNGGLAGVSAGVLQEAVNDVAPLSVTWADDEGWPVDAAAAAGPGDSAYTVVVSNNEEAAWRGEVRVAQAAPRAPARLSACVELRSGNPVPLDADGFSFALTVGAFDVAVVRCVAAW